MKQRKVRVLCWDVFSELVAGCRGKAPFLPLGPIRPLYRHRLRLVLSTVPKGSGSGGHGGLRQLRGKDGHGGGAIFFSTFPQRPMDQFPDCWRVSPLGVYPIGRSRRPYFPGNQGVWHGRFSICSHQMLRGSRNHQRYSVSFAAVSFLHSRIHHAFRPGNAPFRSMYEKNGRAASAVHAGNSSMSLCDFCRNYGRMLHIAPSAQAADSPYVERMARPFEGILLKKGVVLYG